jgi:hypothetical protein
MSRHAPRTSGTLGIVHRVSDAWRVLAVDASGPLPRITAAETIPASAPERVRETLETARVDRVIQIVPASASVCRTCTLPDAGEEALEAALRLQAETWLLAGTPPHRYGQAVLPKADAETSRTGLVTSWPESALVEEAPVPDGVASHWVPEPIALAALLDGERPAEPLLSVDRSRGSVALALCDPTGASIRSTHADLAADWTAAITRVILETALKGDHTPAFARRMAEQAVAGLGVVGEGSAACLLPPSIVDAARRRLERAGGDAAWWNTYGVAAGAALAATGPMASAARLERTVVLARVSRLDRLMEVASRPRTAAIAAAICLLALGGVPVVLSGLRLAVLQWRHGDASELAAEVRDARARLAMYDTLEDRSWSMTKLLSDIAASTPEGITLTNLTISLDQQTFSARGEALGRNEDDARGRVLLMQRQLGETDGLFSSVSFKWDRENNFGAYGFTISADVARPFIQPRYEIDRDFGRWTAWMRQRNMPPPADEPDDAGADGGDGEAPAEAVASASPGEPPARPATGRPAAGGSGAADRGAERDGVDREAGGPTDLAAIPRAERTADAGRTDRAPRELIGGSAGGVEAGGIEARTGAAAGGGDVPEPLTEAQIATFDRPQVLDYMRRVSNARSRFRGVEGQEELEARLSREFDLLKARLREVSSPSGGGAS